MIINHLLDHSCCSFPKFRCPDKIVFITFSIHVLCTVSIKEDINIWQSVLQQVRLLEQAKVLLLLYKLQLSQYVLLCHIVYATFVFGTKGMRSY
jgi:hypothetical protein